MKSYMHLGFCPRDKALAPRPVSPLHCVRHKHATGTLWGRPNKSIPQAFQRTRSTWSLQDLKSIFKHPSILLCTYIIGSKCATDLTILRAEKMFGKASSVVLSRNVDAAHAALMQTRTVQLKENYVFLPNCLPHIPLPPAKDLAAVSHPLFPTVTFHRILKSTPIDTHLLSVYQVSWIAKACLREEKLVIFLASRFLANISEVNQDLFET